MKAVRYQPKQEKEPDRRKPPSALRARLGAAGMWAFAGLVFVLAWFGWGMPDITEVRPLNLRPAITLLASDGSVLTRTGGVKGAAVSLQDLPPDVAHAVLAIEDRRFYDHFGLDPRGLARAMWENAKARRWAQGGSTITQQLAKNLFLAPDKTLRRKAQEAFMALALERRFTKDQILEAYLNRVYFGAGAYGIDAAAQTYFGKNARTLTLWEGAVLAGLLKAPTRYSPAADPARAEERAETVIRAMHAAGYLTEKRMKSELKRGSVAAPPAVATGGARRYFSDWVVDRIDSYINGATGGLVVKTTLDPRLQQLAEAKSAEVFARLSPKDGVSQMALVTLDRDGAVRAMVGGVDYQKSQFNRATQGLRQPGSAFKPFVYLAALEAGFSSQDRILDAPFESGRYRPENYNGKYYGEVTLEKALALSLNTATVRLLQTTGVERLLDVAQRAGFPEEFRPELATGLGAGEVSLIELTNAYAIIANGGRGVLPYAILSISDAEGHTLYSRADSVVVQVFAERDIAALDGMLVQVIAQGTAQEAQLSRGHTAGKTGTTQNYRDAWFVGYTDRLVTGVWMGNDDNTPMNRVTGGIWPARLWHAYMEPAIRLDTPAVSAASPAPVPGQAQEAERPAPDGGSSSFTSMLRRWADDLNIVPSAAPVYKR